MAGPGVVHVALATPCQPVAVPAQEVDRIAALRDPADRAAAGTAAVLLRLLLAEVTGVERQLVRCCATCGGAHGRLHVVGGAAHVSVSWDRAAVAVAVTAAGPVGIDVETDAATGFDGFAGVALAPGETAATATERARLWTRKEALLKAVGTGLAVDPRRVPVQGSVTAWEGRPVQLLEVPSPNGTTCSAAVLTDLPVRLELVDGDALLSR